MLFHFFHFLNFSQCVWGIKISTKLQISKSKGRYFDTKKKQFSRTTTNGSVGLQRCLPVFVISQSRQLEYHQINPAYGNSTGWRVGRTLG